MEYKVKEIKQGIKVHLINNDKFKTNLIAVFLTTELNRENVTKNAIIPAILRRGSENMPTQEAISREMEEMYGASFNCGVDKRGDNQILKFYMETINDNFLPDSSENMLGKSIDKILEIIFNPLVKNNGFCDEYEEQEKENLKQIINGKIDNKASYAMERCIEEMYKNQPFALYKFGYIDDLDVLNGTNLYEYYNQLIQNCKIDIFVSGIVDDSVYDKIIDNAKIELLKPRVPDFVMPSLAVTANNNGQVVTESMDITQGKLVLSLNVGLDSEDQQYDVMIYNSILGGTASSKLFQNVREKASLAYSAGSNFMRAKNTIFIRCGIEIKNYERALDIIRQQLVQMVDGDFSDQDVAVAKKSLVDSIRTIDDEQDTEVLYLFGQEFSGGFMDFSEYIDRVSRVTRGDVLAVAKKIGTGMDTIFFLKG